MDSGLARTSSQACAGCVNLPALPAPRNDESEFTRVGIRRAMDARKRAGALRIQLFCRKILALGARAAVAGGVSGMLSRATGLLARVGVLVQHIDQRAHLGRQRALAPDQA